MKQSKFISKSSSLQRLLSTDFFLTKVSKKTIFRHFENDKIYVLNTDIVRAGGEIYVVQTVS